MHYQNSITKPLLNKLKQHKNPLTVDVDGASAVQPDDKKFKFGATYGVAGEKTKNWKIEISRAFLPPVLHGEKWEKFQFVVEIAHKVVVLILICL